MTPEIWSYYLTNIDKIASLFNFSANPTISMPCQGIMDSEWQFVSCVNVSLYLKNYELFYCDHGLAHAEDIFRAILQDA